MMDCSLIYQGIGYTAQKALATSNEVDSRLEAISPSIVILVTASSAFALTILAKSCQRRWGETWRELAGRLTLRIPYVKKKYTEDVQKQLSHFQESVRKKWEKFGDPVTEMPEKGWTAKELLLLVGRYSKITSDGLTNKHLSGTIYAKGLDSQYCERQFEEFEEKCSEELSNADYFNQLSRKLPYLFNFASSQSCLWNPLHSEEFPVGRFIDYQVVRIVASRFGGSPNEIMGLVTSGGTESLMVFIRACRERGMKKFGHKPGEGVVIASKSVHAAIMKAGQAYLVNIILVDTEENGKINLDLLKKAVKNHGNRVIGMVGSAPCYPTGVIDPIENMAKIAQEHGCPMHVDCCIGAFVLDQLPQHNSAYLKIPGVTSLSADPHKNGLAPKGSSVLITKKLNGEEENLAYYSSYPVRDWPGGLYVTPRDAGSESVKSLNILLAMLAIGNEGYNRIAQANHKTTIELGNIIREFSGKLKLIVEPEVNIVTFQIDKGWGLERGATYAFAHEMAKRNCILNTLSDDAVHFCVTLRFSSHPNALKEFKQAIKESLEAVEELNYKLKAEGKKFSGDAGMYCALEAAIAPNRDQLSTAKFIENILLGLKGADDAMRAYAIAQLDPFNVSEL